MLQWHKEPMSYSSWGPWRASSFWKSPSSKTHTPLAFNVSTISSRILGQCTPWLQVEVIEVLQCVIQKIKISVISHARGCESAHRPQRFSAIVLVQYDGNFTKLHASTTPPLSEPSFVKKEIFRSWSRYMGEKAVWTVRIMKDNLQLMTVVKNRTRTDRSG